MRLIVPVAVLALLGGGAYFYFFMWDDYKNPPAKTPTEAVEKFREAMKKRDYKTAARYCTKNFAEQLTRSAEAGEKLGTSIDDLCHRMKQDGVMTSEMEYVLYANDPFPAERISITVGNEQGNEAVAHFKLDPPRVEQTTQTWPIDKNFVQAYFNGQPSQIRVIKDDKGWKLDFQVTPHVQTCVTRLQDKHMDYVNAFGVLSTEIKRDKTTKENVKKRMQELLQDAVKAEK